MGTTLVDEALHERVTQEPSTSGRSIFDSPIHTSDEYISGSSPPNFVEWVDSQDVSSFSFIQDLIKKEFLAFQSSLQTISTHPVSREVHDAYLKTLKSSFLLSTGLSKQLDHLIQTFISHKIMAAKNEASHLS